MSDSRRFRKMTTERARSPWGAAWDKLTPEMQEAFIAKEALLLLMAQCESMTQYAPAQKLVRDAMGWD